MIALLILWFLVALLLGPRIGKWLKQREDAEFERQVQATIDELERVTKRTERIMTALQAVKARQEKARWN